MSNIREGDASDLADLACDIFDVMTGKELSSEITQEIADLFARYGWPLAEYEEGDLDDESEDTSYYDEDEDTHDCMPESGRPVRGAA